MVKEYNLSKSGAIHPRPHGRGLLAVGVKDKIEDLVSEATELLKNTDVDRLSRERAIAYWIPQLETALNNNHNYLGKCMVTMEDTIEEITTYNDT